MILRTVITELRTVLEIGKKKIEMRISVGAIK